MHFKEHSSAIILGVDPGTQVSGYGLIEVTDRGYTAIRAQEIRTNF